MSEKLILPENMEFRLNEILSGNPEQLKAIRHGAGPMMVLAGPGSGKTFVLTRRIAYLIQAHHIEPSEILVITYTRAAAGEMQQRFLKLCNGTHPPVSFGTFHAIFYSILKETNICQPNSILSDSEKRKILRNIILKNQYRISTNSDMLDEILSEISRFKNLDKSLSEVCYSKNSGILSANFPSNFLPQNIESKLFYQILQAYSETMEILGKVDFDDMAVKCEKLFVQRPDILKHYQKRYRYFLVDEFQDIAPIQYRLIRMLAAPENNLFLVGDDDQSIYGFRGAKPDIMLNFPKDYPDTEIVALKINYRSTPQIVRTASRLISKNKNRFQKNVSTENPAGQSVKIQGYDTRKEQDKALLEALIGEKKKGNLQNCAVICRTSGGFSCLAEELRQAGIPCAFREKIKSIYTHPMVSDLLSYLEFASMKKEERSRALFFQFMNRPLRYISREAVDEKADFRHMIQYYKGRRAIQEEIYRLQDDLERIRNMPVFLAINYIRKAMGYDNYLKENVNSNPYAGYLKENTISNTYVGRLKEDTNRDILLMADIIQNSARECRTVDEWKSVIEQLQKQAIPRETGDMPGIFLLTMHASKGLEYDKVFMPNCNEGITPHRKAESETEMEEERRMFYVGMTRAKKELTLMYLKNSGYKADAESSRVYMPPSRFLKEILSADTRDCVLFPAQNNHSISSNSLLSRNSSKASAARSYSSSSSI